MYSGSGTSINPSKGCHNPPNDSDARPAPPQGSAGPAEPEVRKSKGNDERAVELLATISSHRSSIERKNSEVRDHESKLKEATKQLKSLIGGGTQVLYCGKVYSVKTTHDNPEGYLQVEHPPFRILHP